MQRVIIAVFIVEKTIRGFRSVGVRPLRGKVDA
jgi:hypothetical protein